MGCTLAELYKGKIIFKGFSNRDLVWSQMSLLGPMPRQLIRASRRGHEMFKMGSELSVSHAQSGQSDAHSVNGTSLGGQSVTAPVKYQPNSYYFRQKIRIKGIRSVKGELSITLSYQP